MSSLESSDHVCAFRIIGCPYAFVDLAGVFFAVKCDDKCSLLRITFKILVMSNIGHIADSDLELFFLESGAACRLTFRRFTFRRLAFRRICRGSCGSFTFR